MPSAADSEADVPSPPLSLFTNPYLEELSNNIRNRPVPWDGYHRANLLSEHDLKSIKAVDRVGRSRKLEVINSDMGRYASLLMGLVKSKRVDVLQYALVLGADAATEIDAFASLLNKEEITDILLQLLKHEDETVPILSARLLTILLPSSPGAAFDRFFSYLSTLITSSESKFADLALQSYVGLLTSAPARKIFWQNGGVASVIDKIQESNGNIQLLYHALLVLWELSFDEEIAAELDAQHDAILVLREVGKSAIKEKITRVTVSTLRNLVQKAPRNAARMLNAGLLPILKSLSARKWTDDEISEDLSFLNAYLQDTFDKMTSLDEYVAELETGHLTWSPPHRSKTFWNQNARSLQTSHLQKLTDILKTSQNDEVLAVACCDIRAYLEEIPEARKKLSDMGVKSRVMQLMLGGGKQTRYEALGATQAFVRHSF